MTLASGFGLALIVILIILGMIVCTPERLFRWSAGTRTGRGMFGPRSRSLRGLDVPRH